VTDGQTDRQTDRRTERILIASPRLHSMQRGKNLKVLTGKNDSYIIIYSFIQRGKNLKVLTGKNDSYIIIYSFIQINRPKLV